MTLIRPQFLGLGPAISVHPRMHPPFCSSIPFQYSTYMIYWGPSLRWVWGKRQLIGSTHLRSLQLPFEWNNFENPFILSYLVWRGGSRRSNLSQWHRPSTDGQNFTQVARALGISEFEASSGTPSNRAFGDPYQLQLIINLCPVSRISSPLSSSIGPHARIRAVL